MCHPVYFLMVLILKDVNQDVYYKCTSSAGTSFDKSALKAGVCVGTKSPVTAPRYHQFLENWNCEGMYIIHYSEGDVEVCMKYVYEKYFRDGIEKVIGYGNCTQLGMEKTCLAQWKG